MSKILYSGMVLETLGSSSSPLTGTPLTEDGRYVPSNSMFAHVKRYEARNAELYQTSYSEGFVKAWTDVEVLIPVVNRVSRLVPTSPLFRQFIASARADDLNLGNLRESDLNFSDWITYRHVYVPKGHLIPLRSLRGNGRVVFRIQNLIGTETIESILRPDIYNLTPPHIRNVRDQGGYAPDVSLSYINRHKVQSGQSSFLDTTSFYERVDGMVVTLVVSPSLPDEVFYV